MREFKFKIHLDEWFIKPNFIKNGRVLQMEFLCLTFEILKKKR